MTEIQLSWHGYRYLPYEIDLAKREVEALLGAAPRETDDGLSVELNGRSPELARRLTYVRSALLPDGRQLTTDQALLEDSARFDVEETPLTAGGRQSTRYSAHGLHEYRGKFNPQVVRAIGNMLRLRPGDWLLDPFCGSGTALLESAHSGWNCCGVDMNPLAVLISNAKLQAIGATADHLSRTASALGERLAGRTRGLSFDEQWTEAAEFRVAGKDWMGALPNYDYLSRWFPRSVLVQLSAVIQAIRECASLTEFLQAILSDLARKASYQDPGDLRIRRRSEPRPNYPIVPWYLKALTTRVAMIERARRVGVSGGRQRAFMGDGREPLRWLLGDSGRAGCTFDAAITSPPYATALPYIDTQRLSLALLGLINAREVMTLDQALIGTREIRSRDRSSLELQMPCDPTVPESVRHVCSRMLAELGRSHADGFRRRNMPALVFKYFRDMGQVLRNVADVMRPQGALAILVGRNRTLLNGKVFTIDTPSMLADAGELHGWDLEAATELDTYRRFDMHRRNSIRTESLLILRRRG